MNNSLGKWKSLTHKKYKIINLGRPAIFLLPSHKLQRKFKNTTIENDLHEFLMKNYSAFHYSPLSSSGFYIDGNSQVIYDECRKYEVSFMGKEKIPILMEKLAMIAKLINEDCIYFKAGQYTCLIYPKRKK